MKLNIGKSLTYAGVYNSSTVYQKNSIVEGQYGSTYVSLVDNPGDLDDTTQWKNLFPGIDTSNLSDDIEESTKGMTSKSGYELYSKAMSQIEDCKKIEDKLSNFDYFTVRQALENSEESSIPDLGDIISDNYNLYTDTIEFIVVDDKTITLSDSSTRRGLILVSNKVMSETDLYKLSRDIQTNFVDTSNGKWRFLSSNNINLTGTETDLYTYLEDVRVELGYSNWADHIHELRTVLNQLDTSISDTEYLNLLSNSEKGFFVFDLVATNIGAKYLTGRTYNVDFEDMANDMFKHPDTFRDKYLAGDVITTDYNPNITTDSTIQTNQFKKMNWTIFDRNKRPTRSSNMPIEGNIASYMNTLTDETANNYYTFNLKNDIISLAGQSTVTCGYILVGSTLTIEEDMPVGWYCFLFKGVPKTVDEKYIGYSDVGRRFKNKYVCFYVDSTEQSYFVEGNKIRISTAPGSALSFNVMTPRLVQVGTSSDYVTVYDSQYMDQQTVAQYTDDPTSSTNGWLKVYSTLEECPSGTVYLGHSYDYENGLDSNVSGYGIVGNMTACCKWNDDCYISPTRFWLNSDSDEDYRWLYEWETWIKTNYPTAYEYHILWNTNLYDIDKKGFLSRLPKDVRNSLVPVLHSYWSAHAFTNGVDNDEENFLGQVDPVNEPNSYNNCKLVNYHFYSKVWTPRSSQTTNCKSLITTDTTSGNFKTLALTDKFKYWWGTYRWENEQYDLFKKTPFAYYNRGSSSPYWDFIKQVYPSADKFRNYSSSNYQEASCGYMERCIFSTQTATTGNVDTDSVCRFVQMLGGEGKRIQNNPGTSYTEDYYITPQYDAIIPMLYVGAKSKVTSIDFRDISNEIKNDISTDDRLNDSYEFSYETKGSVVSSRGTGFSTLTTQATVVDNRVKKVLRDGEESSEVVVSLLDKKIAQLKQSNDYDLPYERYSNYYGNLRLSILPYFYGSRKLTLNNYYYFKFHNTPMVNDYYFNNTIKNKWFVFKSRLELPDYSQIICNSPPVPVDMTVNEVTYSCIIVQLLKVPSLKALCESTLSQSISSTICSECICYRTGEQFNFQTTGTISPSSHIVGEIKMFDSEEDLLTEFPTATLIGKAIDPSTGSDNIDYGFGKFGNLNMQVNMANWMTNPIRYWLNSDNPIPGKWFEKYEEDFPVLSQYVSCTSDGYSVRPGFLSMLPKSLKDALVPTKWTAYTCNVFDTKDDCMGQLDFVNNPAGMYTRTIKKFYCYDKVTIQNNHSFSDSKWYRLCLDANLGEFSLFTSQNWFFKLPWLWGDEEYENTHFNGVYEEGLDDLTDSLPTKYMSIHTGLYNDTEYNLQVNFHDISDRYFNNFNTHQSNGGKQLGNIQVIVNGWCSNSATAVGSDGGVNSASSRSEYRPSAGIRGTMGTINPCHPKGVVVNPIYNIGKDGKDLPNLTNVFVKEMVPDVDFEWTNRTTNSKWPAHLGYIDYFKKFNFEQAVDAEDETSDEDE